MIAEDQIKSFPVPVQQKIRDAIEILTRNGHALRHLQLNRDGMVMMDYEAIEMEVDEKFRKSPR